MSAPIATISGTLKIAEPEAKVADVTGRLNIAPEAKVAEVSGRLNIVEVKVAEVSGRLNNTEPVPPPDEVPPEENWWDRIQAWLEKNWWVPAVGGAAIAGAIALWPKKKKGGS